MIGRILHKVHGGSVEALRRFAMVGDLARLMGNPKFAQTYYPEHERKSRRHVWADQLYWLARHGEVNQFYWLYGLDRRPGPRLRDYMPCCEFNVLLEQANSIARINGRTLNYRCLLRDKLLFGAYCETMGIPAAKLLASEVAGRLLWLDSHRLEPFADIVRHEGLSAFCKDRVGDSGRDVFAVAVREGQLWMDDQPVPAAAFAAQVRQRRFVLQQALRQHERCDRLHPASVNTLRLVTIHDAARVVPFTGIMRIGVGDCKRDNAGLGGICVDLDWEREVLFPYGFYMPGHGAKTTAHPDTGIVFEGYAVPFAGEAMRRVIRFHEEMFPEVFSLGWDIAITEQGPVIIEANDGWEITLKPGAQQFDRREFRQLCAMWMDQHGWKDSNG